MFVLIDGVEGKSSVGEAVMAVLFVAVGWSVTNELEDDVPFGEQVLFGNATIEK